MCVLISLEALQVRKILCHLCSVAYSFLCSKSLAGLARCHQELFALDPDLLAGMSEAGVAVEAWVGHCRVNRPLPPGPLGTLAELELRYDWL